MSHTSDGWDGEILLESKTKQHDIGVFGCDYDCLRNSSCSMQCMHKQTSVCFFLCGLQLRHFHLFICCHLEAGFFAGHIQCLDLQHVPETKFNGSDEEKLGQLIVTPEVVASKINNMNENKSPEVDGLSPKILKETVEQISKPLAHVFNMSLQEGMVPLEWKEANSIPLFKKGSRNKSVNYRPVSLTSVICKLLETIIRDHMMDFLVKHKLINTSQHGFLKARSCLTNLLCFF